MKYKELDNKKWEWLHEAILCHKWVSIGPCKHLDNIQAAGLFISPKNNKLYITSIQGESYIYPQKNDMKKAKNG